MNKLSIPNYISRAAFVVAGLLCVFHAPHITNWFPVLIGVTMTAAGILMFADTYPQMKKAAEDKDHYSSRITRSLLLIMLGVSTLLMREDAMAFIGVSWGLIGLIKAGRGITVVLIGSLKERSTMFTLVKAVVELVLSFILLFNPVDAVGKHIVILGLQILVFALFKMDPEKHPKEIVDTLHGHMDEISKTGRKGHN